MGHGVRMDPLLVIGAKRKTFEIRAGEGSFPDYTTVYTNPLL